MQAFVARHPALTQFLVLLGVVILCIPVFGLAWYGIAEAGRLIFTEGCQARGYSCEYESEGLVIGTLVLTPFVIYFFIFVTSKISGLITDRLLRWAGLNPRVALS